MPTAVEALIVLIFFILPGFVLLTFFNRRVHEPPLTDTQFAVRAVFYSVVVHIIFFWWTANMYRWYVEKTLFTQHVLNFTLWALVIVIVAPVILGLILALLSESRRLQPLLDWLGFSLVLRTHSAWNYFFQTREKGCWVIVTLRDNTKIAGKFGNKSFASAVRDPRETPDLYLEEIYEMRDDGYFGQSRPRSQGMWISGADIVSIEFIE